MIDEGISEYIRDEIIHALRVENALIGVYERTKIVNDCYGRNATHITAARGNLSTHMMRTMISIVQSLITMRYTEE